MSGYTFEDCIDCITYHRESLLCAFPILLIKVCIFVASNIFRSYLQCEFV